jgi:hypothetical protein
LVVYYEIFLLQSGGNDRRFYYRLDPLSLRIYTRLRSHHSGAAYLARDKIATNFEYFAMMRFWSLLTRVNCASSGFSCLLIFVFK